MKKKKQVVEMGTQMAAEKEDNGKTKKKQWKNKARENREEAGRCGRTGI